MIDFHDHPFLAFSVLTWHLENTGIGVFWLQYAARYERERSATKRLLHQQVKRLVVLVTFHAQKCVSKSISGSADIPKVHDCDLLRQMSSQ